MDKPVSWRDVIIISRDSQMYSDAIYEVDEYYQRLERFLDFVENTDLGQEMLGEIRAKNQELERDDKRLMISFVDGVGRNHLHAEQRITLNFANLESYAFFDMSTQSIKTPLFERVALHEIFHGSDTFFNKSKGLYYENSEEYAVQCVDKFSKEHMPELGVRGISANGFRVLDRHMKPISLEDAFEGNLDKIERLKEQFLNQPLIDRNQQVIKKNQYHGRAMRVAAASKFEMSEDDINRVEARMLQFSKNIEQKLSSIQPTGDAIELCKAIKHERDFDLMAGGVIHESGQLAIQDKSTANFYINENQEWVEQLDIVAKNYNLENDQGIKTEIELIKKEINNFREQLSISKPQSGIVQNAADELKQVEAVVLNNLN